MSEKREELAREYREELTRKYREAVASHLGGEQLEAVGPFWRAGWLNDWGEEPRPWSIKRALDTQHVAPGQPLPPSSMHLGFLGLPKEVVTLRVTRGEQTEDVEIDVAKLDENPLAIDVYAALEE